VHNGERVDPATKRGDLPRGGRHHPLRHVLFTVMATAAVVAVVLGFPAVAGSRAITAEERAVFVTPVGHAAGPVRATGAARPTTPVVGVAEPPAVAVAVTSARTVSAAHPAPAPARKAAAPTAAAVVTVSAYGCASALTYLESHAAPGFAFECPGYSLGHQAMTCIDVAGACPGMKLIAISDPCPAAYMNEASNSWVLEGLRRAPIDPYGYCH